MKWNTISDELEIGNWDKMNIGDREWQIRRSTRAPLRPPPHPPTTTHTGGAHTRPRICIRTRREDRGRPRDTRDSPVCNTRGARATPATLPWLPRFGGSRRAKPPATPPCSYPPPRFRAARKVGGDAGTCHQGGS